MPLLIQALIDRRCRELGMTSDDLVYRLGYANHDKARRRLRELQDGRFERAAHLLDKLPEALLVPATAVQDAIEETRAELASRAREELRKAFRPHAIIRTERSTPTQVTLAAVLRIDRLLKIDLDVDQPASSYRRLALREMNLRAARVGGVIPLLRKVTGVSVAFTADRTVAYNVDGTATKLEGAIGEPRCELKFRNALQESSLSRCANPGLSATSSLSSWTTLRLPLLPVAQPYY